MRRVNVATARNRRPVRTIVLINFSLIVIYFIPGTHRAVDRMLTVIDSDDFVAWCLDLWVVGSTLIATGIFVRNSLKNSATAAVDSRRPVIRDGMLLFSWWATLLAICLYAFTLGLRGF
jgi:hypothetical protein